MLTVRSLYEINDRDLECFCFRKDGLLQMLAIKTSSLLLFGVDFIVTHLCFVIYIQLVSCDPDVSAKPTAVVIKWSKLFFFFDAETVCTARKGSLYSFSSLTRFTFPSWYGTLQYLWPWGECFVSKGTNRLQSTNRAEVCIHGNLWVTRFAFFTDKLSLAQLTCKINSDQFYCWILECVCRQTKCSLHVC